jgi:hypothetical protein
MIDNEHLYLLIVAAGGKRPAKGTSEDDLRQLLRDAIEAKTEAADPVAGYDEREAEAVGAAFPKWTYAMKATGTTDAF